MIPFDAEELAYIEALDPKADIDLLCRELPGFRLEALRVLEVATTLLKRCAAAGLNLAEIGTIISRPLVRLPEVLDWPRVTPLDPTGRAHLCRHLAGASVAPSPS